MPAQLTTASARIISPSAITPTARPFSTTMRSTFVFSKIFTPAERAPLARACVTSIGLTTPSPGKCTAPTRSSTRASGTKSFTSAGVMMLTGRPNTRAIDAPRLSSSKRSSFGAIATEPRCWKPVACPVSSSRVANKFVVY